MGVVQTLKCPIPLQRERVFIGALVDSTLHRNPFNISLGSFEAIDIYAVQMDSIISPSGNFSEASRWDVGISTIDLDGSNTQAEQEVSSWNERDDLLLMGKFKHQTGNDSTGSSTQAHYHEWYNFPVPLCVPESPTLLVNAYIITHPVDITVTLYYIKKTLAQNIFFQLLKWYGNAKGVFKTGVSNEYDT